MIEREIEIERKGKVMCEHWTEKWATRAEKKIWRISAHILSHTDQIIQQNSSRTSENVHIYKIHNECHCCCGGGGGDSDCHFPLGMVKSYGGNECAEEESTITTTETRCSSIFRNWQKDSCRKKDSRTFWKWKKITWIVCACLCMCTQQTFPIFFSLPHTQLTFSHCVCVLVTQSLLISFFTIVILWISCIVDS